MLLKVSVLFAVWSVVRTCDDVNTVACGQLDRLMNVCTDPCFSNLCQRYCGKCPLKCYHCMSTNITDCTDIMECPNMEHACVNEKYLTNNFTFGYKRGCVHNQVCNQLYGTACYSVGECSDQRGYCCKSDLCNRNTPSRRASRDVHTQKGNVDQNRITKRINSVECSSCNHIDSPEYCNVTKICDPYEKCFTLKTRSTEGTFAYNLGCLHQMGCTRLQESLPARVFGRSDIIFMTVQGQCCSSNLCNKVTPARFIMHIAS
ncbi:uncharacterized protein LOC128184931 isoform X2 [Crassostrea angulata]|uniref:uncharacterized protein LOC128184931 isoform X2 n=1 Tax=Magallana angulata TaxID=2784310 RepID=UPI0022B0ED58|nr:uncharacterized protein LOC128184931 isoform X2 [Crassostrea angulata]